MLRLPLVLSLSAMAFGFSPVAAQVVPDLATIDLANLTSFQNFVVSRANERQGLGPTGGLEVSRFQPLDVATNEADLSGLGGLRESLQPDFWAGGYGVLGSLGGAPAPTGTNTDYNTGGIAAGVDAMVADRTIAGLALAYEHTSVDSGQTEAATDSGSIASTRVGLYGSHDFQPLVLDGAAGYAFNDYRNSRGPALAAASSRHDGDELTIEGGISEPFTVRQSLALGTLMLVPRLGFEYDDISQSAFTESGAGVLDLAANGVTLNALRSTAGGRAEFRMATDNGTLVTPVVRAFWLHDYEDVAVPLSETLSGSGLAMVVSGAHPGRDAALAGTGVRVGFGAGLDAIVDYNAEVRSEETDHTIEIGLRLTW